MWVRENDGSIFHFNQMPSVIRICPPGTFILLEGPSNCGKSNILRALKDMNNNVLILTCENLKETYLHRNQQISNALLRALGPIAVEDIDLIQGYAPLEDWAWYWLARQSANKIIIITGIDIKKRIPRFIWRLVSSGSSYIIYSYSDKETVTRNN